MAQILTSFGFHTRNVTDTDTNTNIANANLTQDDNRTLTGGGNTLTFTGQTLTTFEQPIRVSNGTGNPTIQLLEPSGSGTNTGTITCGALGSDRIYTFPDESGTIALLEARQIFTDRNTIENREFVVSSATDGDTIGDSVYFGTTSVIVGRLYYWDGSGWAASDASAEATAKGMLAVSMGTGNANSVGMCIRGMVTLSIDAGDNGDVLYLSETASQATNTAPTTSGAIVRVIGYCMDDTNGQIYFNPDGSWVQNA